MATVAMTNDLAFSDHELAIASTVEEGKSNLDAYGYTVHKNFLTPEQLDRTRDRLEEQARLERAAGVATVSSTGHADKDRGIGGSKDSVPVSQLIDFLPNKGRAFLDLMHNPVSMAYGEHVFRGVPFNVAAQAGAILRNGGKRQVLHADQQAWPFGTPIPVMFNVLVCLSDFDEDMGATNVVPGSHRHGSPDLNCDPREAAKKIGSRLLPMVAQAGDALVFESRTWHCQGTSTSSKVRMSIATLYAMHFVKPQDFYPAVMHDDVYETLSGADRDMLGFKVHYEYAGRIAPRNPTDFRTNTNAHYPYVPELSDGGANRAVALADMRVAKTERLAESVA